MNPSTWGSTTASALIFRALRRFPDRIAFAWDGGHITYAGTLALIGQMQSVMAPAVTAKPLRVALLSANRAEAWCAEAAVQALGGSVTWLHPMGSLSDHLDQLNDARVDALVLDVRAFRSHAGELAVAMKHLGNIWTLGPATFGNDLLAAAERMGSATARDCSRPEDIVTLNYTGGTTGKSKAAMRRQRGHAAMWLAIMADFELPEVPRYLAAAPISHVAGTKVAPVLLRGGTVHLMQRFDSGQFLATVQRERINMSLLVPTMIYTLLDDPSFARTDLSSLELLIYGASPMSPTRLLESMVRIGPVLSQLYGQTECYPIAVLRKGDHQTERPDLFGSCGAPIASTQVCLLDDNGRPVAAGSVGEVCVRAAHAMETYWNREDLTRETLVDGWLHTGDLARQDEQGYLFIVDRKKDMIVSGGFNVYPREIEDVLSSDPSVSAAAVIGVPDAKWGEAVMAVVVPRPGVEVNVESLKKLVRERKGSQHAPKHVEIVRALPLTPLGKVNKKALREPYWAGNDRQVA